MSASRVVPFGTSNRNKPKLPSQQWPTPKTNDENHPEEPPASRQKRMVQNAILGGKKPVGMQETTGRAKDSASYENNPKNRLEGSPPKDSDEAKPQRHVIKKLAKRKRKKRFGIPREVHLNESIPPGYIGEDDDFSYDSITPVVANGHPKPLRLLQYPKRKALKTEKSQQELEDEQRRRHQRWRQRMARHNIAVPPQILPSENVHESSDDDNSSLSTVESDQAVKAPHDVNVDRWQNQAASRIKDSEAMASSRHQKQPIDTIKHVSSQEVEYSNKDEKDATELQSSLESQLKLSANAKSSRAKPEKLPLREASPLFERPVLLEANRQWTSPSSSTEEVHANTVTATNHRNADTAIAKSHLASSGNLGRKPKMAPCNVDRLQNQIASRIKDSDAMASSHRHKQPIDANKSVSSLETEYINGDEHDATELDSSLGSSIQLKLSAHAKSNKSKEEKRPILVASPPFERTIFLGTSSSSPTEEARANTVAAVNNRIGATAIAKPHLSSSGSREGKRKMASSTLVPTEMSIDPSPIVNRANARKLTGGKQDLGKVRPLPTCHGSEEKNDSSLHCQRVAPFDRKVEPTTPSYNPSPTKNPACRSPLLKSDYAEYIRVTGHVFSSPPVAQKKGKSRPPESIKHHAKNPNTAKKVRTARLSAEEPKLRAQTGRRPAVEGNLHFNAKPVYSDESNKRSGSTSMQHNVFVDQDGLSNNLVGQDGEGVRRYAFPQAALAETPKGYRMWGNTYPQNEATSTHLRAESSPSNVCLRKHHDGNLTDSRLPHDGALDSLQPTVGDCQARHDHNSPNSHLASKLTAQRSASRGAYEPIDKEVWNAMMTPTGNNGSLVGSSVELGLCDGVESDFTDSYADDNTFSERNKGDKILAASFEEEPFAKAKAESTQSPKRSTSNAASSTVHVNPAPVLRDPNAQRGVPMNRPEAAEIRQQNGGRLQNFRSEGRHDVGCKFLGRFYHSVSVETGFTTDGRHYTDYYVDSYVDGANETGAFCSDARSPMEEKQRVPENVYAPKWDDNAHGHPRGMTPQPQLSAIQPRELMGRTFDLDNLSAVAESLPATPALGESVGLGPSDGESLSGNSSTLDTSQHNSTPTSEIPSPSSQKTDAELPTPADSSPLLIQCSDIVTETGKVDAISKSSPQVSISVSRKDLLVEGSTALEDDLPENDIIEEPAAELAIEDDEMSSGDSDMAALQRPIPREIVIQCDGSAERSKSLPRDEHRFHPDQQSLAPVTDCASSTYEVPTDEDNDIEVLGLADQRKISTHRHPRKQGKTGVRGCLLANLPAAFALAQKQKAATRKKKKKKRRPATKFRRGCCSDSSSASRSYEDQTENAFIQAPWDGSFSKEVTAWGKGQKKCGAARRRSQKLKNGEFPVSNVLQNLAAAIDLAKQQKKDRSQGKRRLFS